MLTNCLYDEIHGPTFGKSATCCCSRCCMQSFLCLKSCSMIWHHMQNWPSIIYFAWVIKQLDYFYLTVPCKLYTCFSNTVYLPKSIEKISVEDCHERHMEQCFLFERSYLFLNCSRIHLSYLLTAILPWDIWLLDWWFRSYFKAKVQKT